MTGLVCGEDEGVMSGSVSMTSLMLLEVERGFEDTTLSESMLLLACGIHFNCASSWKGDQYPTWVLPISLASKSRISCSRCVRLCSLSLFSSF